MSQFISVTPICIYLKKKWNLSKCKVIKAGSGGLLLTQVTDLYLTISPVILVDIQIDGYACNLSKALFKGSKYAENLVSAALVYNSTGRLRAGATTSGRNRCSRRPARCPSSRKSRARVPLWRNEKMERPCCWRYIRTKSDGRPVLVSAS